MRAMVIPRFGGPRRIRVHRQRRESAALKVMWCDLKCQEIDNIKRMKQLLAEEIQQNCF